MVKTITTGELEQILGASEMKMLAEVLVCYDNPEYDYESYTANYHSVYSKNLRDIPNALKSIQTRNPH